ncbi:hypothetical protein [Prosthecobacter sp.]|uniref:hypothetical protein n=1 Tax=Prosthecobacter sp. TaxID=1965333 RepID=UPI001D934853|nr:hypothetical protein [Prosthecobacter sp.]MCB1279137.1 hypothetical protein [Prosthecobacter sp.]
MSGPSNPRSFDTTSALFGVAIIQALIGFVGYLSFDWRRFTWFQWAIMLSAFLYIALGIAAKKHPRLAVGLGIGFFVAYLLAQALIHPPLVFAGLIHKIPVSVLLLTGLDQALRQTVR